jgi:hypothetical protein
LECSDFCYIGITPEKRLFFDDQGGDAFFFRDPEHTGLRLIAGDQADVHGRVASEKIDDSLRV